MSFRYKYARPALTADCVVFGLDEGDLKVLLIRRGRAPFKGMWALPGGFANVGESLEDTARRELAEETGLANLNIEQFHTFSEPGRDPREHTVTVAYFAVVNIADHTVQAADDADGAAWFPAGDPPPLAFDHGRILAMALTRLGNLARTGALSC